MSTYSFTLSPSRHFYSSNGDITFASSSWSTSPESLFGASLGTVWTNYGTRYYECGIAYTVANPQCPDFLNSDLYEITNVYISFNCSAESYWHHTNADGSYIWIDNTTYSQIGLLSSYPGPQASTSLVNTFAYVSTGSNSISFDSSDNYATLMNALKSKPSLLCVALLPNNNSQGTSMVTPGTSLQLNIEYRAKYVPILAPTWKSCASSYYHNSKIYVSNNGSTPSGKNNITLQWNQPAITNNTLDHYTLYVSRNDGSRQLFSTTTALSYSINFANFKINNNTVTLKQGDKLIFYISSTGEYGGESSLRSFSPIYINYWPTKPIITNTVIPSTSSGINLSYTLGTDNNEGMPTSFRWMKDVWQFRTAITSSDVGTYNAYTYDNWDISSPTQFTIRKNTTIVLTVTANYGNSESSYTNDTISNIKVSATESSKTLSNIRYYVRASQDLNTISTATPSQIVLSNGSYTINPFDPNSPIHAGDYYQIGARANDGVEDSIIYWYTSKTPQVYGGITLSKVNIPQITHSDELVGVNLTGDYSNYYKNKTIKINYQLPSIPTGLTKLYYQFAYLSNPQTNTWATLGSRIEFTSVESGKNYNTNITIPVILASLQFKMYVYNAVNNETQVVSSGVSNILYYVSPPSWGNNTGSVELTYADINNSMTNDGRYCIRPTIGEQAFNSDGTSVNAFSLTIPTPSSICQIAPNGIKDETNDLRYSIKVSNGTQIISLIQNQMVPGYNTTNPNFNIVFSYQQLNKLNLYNLCATQLENRIGPYTLTLVIEFQDPFANTLNTLTNNLIIDFREKPPEATNILLGRNGVLYSTNYTQQLREQIKDIQAIFPSNDSTDTEKIIFNNEVLLVSFQQSSSYPAQIIQEYYIDLYNNMDNLITTYRITPDKAVVYKDDENVYDNVYEITIDNLFYETTTCYVKIRAKDSRVYTQNISLPINKSNVLIGCTLETPTITLSNISFTFLEKRISYTIPSLVFSEDNNSLKDITVSWPTSYQDLNTYNRSINYENQNYLPTCQYFLEISPYPNFSESILINLGEKITEDNYMNLNYEGETGSILESYTKIYVRGKIEYATGLICTGPSNSPTGIGINTQIIYSQVLTFLGNQPTVAYRKNSVGINTLPQSDEVFSISSYGSKNMITFSGEDGDEPTLIHTLKFNLQEGKLITKNFDLGLNIVTEAEIEAFSFLET